jgi:hypothetical protein
MPNIRLHPQPKEKMTMANTRSPLLIVVILLTNIIWPGESAVGAPKHPKGPSEKAEKFGANNKVVQAIRKNSIKLESHNMGPNERLEKRNTGVQSTTSSTRGKGGREESLGGPYK